MHFDGPAAHGPAFQDSRQLELPAQDLHRSFFSAGFASWPASAFCKKAGRCPRISARESGSKVTISIRPARLSEIFGSVRMLAHPVSKNMPGGDRYQSTP